MLQNNKNQCYYFCTFEDYTRLALSVLNEGMKIIESIR